jgi:DNA-directed RNA polymerase specialized sigma24 family protein
LRRLQTPRLIEKNEDVENREQIHLCLDSCLEKLAPYARQLIERYYAADRQAKIDLRKVIARELGIKTSTLRLRALRIRAQLQRCIESCLDACEASAVGEVSGFRLERKRPRLQ